MWRLKQLIPKEQAGLEGRTVEVGSLRLQIRSTIAQGGFSCVYLARDAQSGKLFALKHIICNDTESLDLVKQEVSALKTLRGHPNIVNLHAQSMYDMGRTKECFLVTEYCEKMMVDVLDSRGAGYFEEKQLLMMFRDICNAVYAMHCQSPPIAHRDLKAENLLLGSDGQWKLCDFGSTSTNHKRFEKAAEMGVEEDIIRKHTTPAYRAPEMWDLYRREIISEKVDIWALGCLLYRMAYFKSAFDGESKLQILNGNYRLPDLPKYSANITGLIKDMLNSSPEARPDAMQVWHRVNSSLPSECQKISPDKAPSTLPSQDNASNAAQGRQPSVIPTRSPPPPPQRNTERGSPPSIQKESDHRSSTLASKETDHGNVYSVGKGGGLGSFWSTQYAQEAHHDDDKNPPARNKSVSMGSQPGSLSKSPPLQGTQGTTSLFSEPQSMRSDISKKWGPAARKYSGPSLGVDDSGDTRLDDDNGGDYDVRNQGGSSVRVSQVVPHAESVIPTIDEAFNEFVADFQKASNFAAENKGAGGEGWQVELENLKKELKQAQKEKLEIASKYEKLTAICRSQRVEIQELKSSLAATNNQSVSFQAKEPVPQTRPPSSLSSQKPERQVGTIWDLKEGLSSPGISSSEPQGWRAFSDAASKQVFSGKKDPHQDFSSLSDTFGSATFDFSRSEVSTMKATTGNSQPSKVTRLAGDVWEAHDNFAALGAGFTATKGMGQGSQGGGVISNATAYDANSFKGTSRPANHSQPSGWSNF